jgi:hypothetical protein
MFPGLPPRPGHLPWSRQEFRHFQVIFQPEGRQLQFQHPGLET